MLNPLSEDVLLFSKDALEGEYRTWTHVWTRDYGAGATLWNLKVDNYGRVYSEDLAIFTSYTRDYLGNEVNTLLYVYWLTFLFETGPQNSITQKYQLGTPTATPTQFDVWRYGALIFSRDTVLDEADSASIQIAAMSPNGKFIAIIINSVASLNPRYILLYEGV